MRLWCLRVISFSVLLFYLLFLFFLRFYLFFRERGREKEREGEKYQCVVASCMPLPLGTRPPTQACALTGKPFGLQACAQSTELHQPGSISIFKHFLLIDFLERERETLICCSTYLYIHCWFLYVPWPGIKPYNLGILGRCSNQLSYMARASISF